MRTVIYKNIICSSPTKKVMRLGHSLGSLKCRGFCPPASRPLPGALPREEQRQRGRIRLLQSPLRAGGGQPPPGQNTDRRICKSPKGTAETGLETTGLGSTPASARARDRVPRREAGVFIIYVSIYPVYPLIHLSIYVYSFIHLSIHLLTYLSIHPLSIYLSIHQHCCSQKLGPVELFGAQRKGAHAQI